MEKRFPEEPSQNYYIMVMAYASFSGLSGALLHSGIIRYPSDLGLFAQGFSAREHFHFTFVGFQKEAADRKIRGAFPGSSFRPSLLSQGSRTAPLPQCPSSSTY